MRSGRRLSCTSICDQALSTWLRRLTRPLKPSQKNSPISSTMTTITMTAIMCSCYLGDFRGPASSDRGAGRDDRPFVEGQEEPGEGIHREPGGAAGPFGGGSGPAHRVVEQRPEGTPQGIGVAGGHEQ